MQEIITLYKKIVTKLEKGDSNDSIRLPKLVSPFQKHLYDKLKELSKLIDERDELIYVETYATKSHSNDIAIISPSASEIKTLVNTSKMIRAKNKEIRDIEADIKYLEEMIGVIKSHSFNLNIYQKLSELGN